MFDDLDGEYLKITYLEEEREETINKCIQKLHLLMQIETRITIHIGRKICNYLVQLDAIYLCVF